MTSRNWLAEFNAVANSANSANSPPRYPVPGPIGTIGTNGKAGKKPTARPLALPEEAAERQAVAEVDGGLDRLSAWVLAHVQTIHPPAETTEAEWLAAVDRVALAADSFKKH